MKFMKIGIFSILLSGLLALLSIPLPAGKLNLPPLGNFLSPFTGFWQNAESGKTPSQTLNLGGVKSKVTVVYDKRRVPHIYGENLEDVLFAQGYILAKERLWQMDVSVRSVAGRMAEVLGERALASDLEARRMGYLWAAEKAAETWSDYPPGVKISEAFSNGINTYIAQLDKKDYPLEFKLLNYDPEPWNMLKTALFIKSMCKTLNSRHTDIATTNIYNILGEEVFKDLYPEYNKKQKPVIQEKSWESPFPISEAAIKPEADLIQTGERTSPEIFVGSNNFAINGKKSANGYPILANDPHLRLTLPSIWLEMHLSTPEFNAYGVSLAGLPGIILGFNDDIAWGQTNAGLDVLDLYKIEWASPDLSSYYLDGEIMPTEMKIEAINVKGKGVINDTILYTYWGPVKKEVDGKQELAQRWISHNTPYPDEPEIYININKAKNYAEFKSALKSFYAPMQNFIFASREGDIALHVTGAHPVKKEGQGRFVLNGASTEYDWKAYIPFDEMPFELNPSRNFVSSANQHSTDTTYPYYYYGGFEDYRGIRIHNKLEEMQNGRREDLMALQLDDYSLKAAEALPLVLSILDTTEMDGTELNIYEELADWDFHYAVDSKMATVFEKFWRQIYNNTFDEILGFRAENDIEMPESFRLIEMMTEEPDHPFFDLMRTPEKEGFTDIANISFHELELAVHEPEPWCDYRSTVITHLGMLPGFESGHIHSPGTGDTPNAISKYNGPSWRMVVELSDPVKGFGIYPGGQSGNPGSKYYDNFIDDWASGKYYELENSRDPAEIESLFTITFQPQKQ